MRIWAMQALETPGLLIQELAPTTQRQLVRAQRPFAVSVSQACHQARFEPSICITLQGMRIKLNKSDDARDRVLRAVSKHCASAGVPVLSALGSSSCARTAVCGQIASPQKGC